jgi:membrane protein DedA with SNARE-associated domain
MPLAELLTQYGYYGLFVGCFLEGETVLLLAGVAAHGGYLSFPIVVAVAFVGGTLGDQFFFFIGRRYGEPLVERWPRFHASAQRVRRMIVRHSAPLIIGIRFMYGLRLIGPVVIGTSPVPARRFAVFNMIGAAIWALGVGGIGYLFGHAIEWFLGDLEVFEKIALVAIVVVAALLLVVRRWLVRPRR